MKFEDFSAGDYRQQYQYKSFSPVMINREWQWSDPALNVLLETAARKLGELRMFTAIVPNIDLYISMHIIKEANNSSRIEGTRTEIDEALRPREEIRPERRDDWQEVQNYIQAMNESIHQLKTLPLSVRLLKDTHRILMQGVRGEHKSPGEFRHSQNWIGGSNLSDAVFIPPHHSELSDLMSDLENFWHNDQIQVPHLIRIALSHYQFETIHPFLDGNGRIGRLLITLYLVSFGLLSRPSLYLSYFFEQHRSSYYDALSRVRQANDVIHWIKFFLNGIIVTADKGIFTFEAILQLKAKTDAIVLQLGRRAENTRAVMDLFYQQPVLNAREISNNLSINERTVRNILSAMEAENIIEEATGYKRNKVFKFSRYLELF